MQEACFKTVVEFEDVDLYGIAHHSKLINYLERARVHFLEDTGLSISDGSFNLVLANMTIRFHSPVKIMDKVEIFSHIERLSNFSLIWKYRIMKEETKVLEAEIKMASIDGKSLKPVKIPDAYREALLSISK